MASKISLTIKSQTAAGWWGVYYLLIATNAASVLAWYLFYRFATFKMLHRRKEAKDLLFSFDWVGLCLYIAGMVTFLLGLQWGGTLYPWKSAHVIAAMLAGTFGLVLFILWEWYLSRKSTKAVPFAPLWYMRNFKFMAITIMSGIGGSSYYGFSMIWPAAVATDYTGLSNSENSTLYGLVTMSHLYGQATITLLSHWIVPKYLLIASMCISCPILACVAINPLNMSLTMGLIIVGCIFVGGMEGVALVTTTFPLRTQEEIGTAGGLSGTAPLFFSSVSAAIYAAVLNNRLASTIQANVVAAATHAGLPTSSILMLLTGLSGAAPLNSTTVPGLTPTILDLSSQAYRAAHAKAYSTVFLVSLAFTIPGVVLCWFTAKNDKAQEDFVVGSIHKKGEEKELEDQDG